LLRWQSGLVIVTSVSHGVWEEYRQNVVVGVHPWAETQS